MNMLTWGILFLLIAIVAAALGFGRLSGTAAWAAKLVFIVAIILLLANIIMGYRV